eukprot:2672462-Rhodomonas_salina.1
MGRPGPAEPHKPRAEGHRCDVDWTRRLGDGERKELSEKGTGTPWASTDAVLGGSFCLVAPTVGPYTKTATSLRSTYAPLVPEKLLLDQLAVPWPVSGGLALSAYAESVPGIA